MCSVFHICLNVGNIVGFYDLRDLMSIKIGGAKGCFICYLMLVRVWSSLDCNYPMRVCHHQKGGDCWLC